MAPETRLLPAILRAHPPVMSTDCPAGEAAIPQPVLREPMATVLPWSRSPCSPLPQPFCDVSGTPPPAKMIVHRWQWGPGIAQEQCRGPAGDCPPPHRAHTGDLTPIMPVKGTYLGKIESRLRPGNCDSRPRNVISQELTSILLITADGVQLMNTHTNNSYR